MLSSAGKKRHHSLTIHHPAPGRNLSFCRKKGAREERFRCNLCAVTQRRSSPPPCCRPEDLPTCHKGEVAIGTKKKPSQQDSTLVSPPQISPHFGVIFSLNSQNYTENLRKRPKKCWRKKKSIVVVECILWQSIKKTILSLCCLKYIGKPSQIWNWSSCL